MFWRKHASRFDSNDVNKREAKINELKAALGPLSPRGDKYCSAACLTRYLEARHWNVAKSRENVGGKSQVEGSIQARGYPLPEVSVEGETGKMYRASFQDREGRTIVVMRPAKQASPAATRAGRHPAHV